MEIEISSVYLMIPTLIYNFEVIRAVGLLILYTFVVYICHASHLVI